MKVVSVMTTAARGGAEFAAVEMLDALAERGHEVVMLSDQPEIGRGTRVHVHALELGPKLSVRSWRRLMLGWVRLRGTLRDALAAEAPYDVLLVHYKKEQLLTRTLPASLRPRVVWAEWGPVPFPMRRGIPRRMYLDAARHADAIMAVSEGTKRSVCAVGVAEDRVHVVPNVMRTEALGFSPEGRARVRGELGIPAEAFVVGCISRFHPKKRNDVVVAAVAALNDERVHLVLAGDGETEADLRARAAPLGSRAHFVATPGADVADVLSTFDVSVFCPSPTEGQPRAVILAMLAGRPCVATGPEGVADMIVDGVGTITEPENDVAALTATLEGYLTDPRRAAAEGAAARERALALYDARVVAARVEALMAAAAG